MIRIAIPALAVLLALLLYRRRPMAYLTLALWSWLLTPLVRRLVDYRLGWEDPNFVLLTPQLVSMVSVLALFHRRRAKDALPTAVLLAMAGIAYGFAVGMVMRPSGEIVYGLVNWMGPLLLGLHVATCWRNYPEHEAWLTRNVVCACAVLGSYGIVQYLVAPAWDTYWLEQITGGLIDPSFGLPEPMGIRVWSTLNSPGPFANAMAALLLLLFAVRSRWKVVAAAAGYASFLLSLVRTAWLAWLLALVLFLRRASSKLIQRAILFTVICVAVLIPALQLPGVSPLLTERFKTLSQLTSDESFVERSDMYRIVGAVALRSPFGHGLRNQEIVGNRVVDSGLLVMLLSLGWLGILLYGAGVLAFVLRRARARNDDLARVCEAICLAYLVQLVGGPVFTSVTGALFWICAGTCISADRWHAAQQPATAEQPVISGVVLRPLAVAAAR